MTEFGDIRVLDRGYEIIVLDKEVIYLNGIFYQLCPLEETKSKTTINYTSMFVFWKVKPQLIILECLFLSAVNCKFEFWVKY